MSASIRKAHCQLFTTYVIWKVPLREFSQPEGGRAEGTMMPVTGRSVAGGTDLVALDWAAAEAASARRANAKRIVNECQCTRASVIRQREQ